MHFSHTDERITVDMVKPGYVLNFSYKGRSFGVLAVSCARSGPGSSLFKNTKTGNKLLACYKIDQLSLETLATIVTKLDKYGTRFNKVASYRYVKNLFGIFIGKNQFRTFIAMNNQVSGLKKITVEQLEEDTE